MPAPPRSSDNKGGRPKGLRGAFIPFSDHIREGVTYDPNYPYSNGNQDVEEVQDNLAQFADATFLHSVAQAAVDVGSAEGEGETHDEAAQVPQELWDAIEASHNQANDAVEDGGEEVAQVGASAATDAEQTVALETNEDPIASAAEILQLFTEEGAASASQIAAFDAGRDASQRTLFSGANAFAEWSRVRHGPRTESDGVAQAVGDIETSLIQGLFDHDKSKGAEPEVGVDLEAEAEAEAQPESSAVVA